jgi:hypothetical protein
MSKWFWKTLKGYRVIYATPNYDIVFDHRPFQEPRLKKVEARYHSGTKTLVFDEASEWTPEMQKTAEAISNKYRGRSNQPPDAKHKN